ncbi:MAG: N-acetyl-gamma-glutamyl-phosphate reductase [Acidimicrobiia bacterium]|nr:N-acetyl-gamma-glutamyl-phosphate reductase [Acidimicrobiia bacterium]
MKRVGIIGASGFAGAELMRLCAGHPEFEVVFASGDSQAGTPVGELYPSLAAAYPTTTLEPWESIPGGLDVVFIALPHGASQTIVPKLDASHILDLGADFRLKDTSLYPTWYGQEHTAPELLDEFAFGLPELFREDLLGATRVAVPGCYVTTATLTLAPLLKAGLVEPHGLVVDAASGVSGAGRAPKPGTTFSAVDENFTAYGLLNHRHTPEMEMAIGRHAGTDVQLLFTPHLAPMNRGILATCYARPTGDESTEELLTVMAAAYADESFVVVSEAVPSTKATLGSNSVHITVRRDERTGWVVAIGALDNLVKGAAGQAIQCANLAVGLDEAAGLASAGMYP